MDGEPNRFVTLTVNPHCFDSPAERGARLARAWRDYVREWRRQRPGKTLEYLVVLELTKRGEPHLHIIIRGGRIPHAELSNFMNKALSAPVVDVRMVRERSQVAKYVAKYISKRPIRLGQLKRYWRSLRYFTDEVRARRNRKEPNTGIWVIDISLWDLKSHLHKTNVFQWQTHSGNTVWKMYHFETGPPVSSNLVRRLR